jgi:ubiquinone/menaquinone biosynthesis C-methylase UbiE
MEFRARLRGRLLDWMMRQMDGLRPEVLEEAQGEVLEVGFGTGLNLAFYPPGVTKLVGLDPNPADGLPALEERVQTAAFEVERCALRADGALPFDAGRFDTVVTTWTLCSISDSQRALAEMRRVLKPGGRYLFIEHGRAPAERTALWQDRVNPLWRSLTGGCNMNLPIDRIVNEGGFELAGLERFRHTGPELLAHMYRGIATRAV